MTTIGTPLLWIAVTGVIVALLVLDLVVFHKKPHEVKSREALIWSGIWIALAAVFGLVLWPLAGPTAAGEFATGYLIEKSLSVDNLFVFLVLFSYFKVPGELRHRVLFWGVLGALVLRGVFIVAGAALLARFEWVLWVFGAILLFTAVKLLAQDEEPDPGKNRVLRAFRRLVPMTEGWRGAAFLVREGGRRLATPLLAVLVTVEATDVVFAVDSIPAIFGVTRDPFIVFTSNAFAILGLRALFFVLAGILHRFHYLRHGLAGVLAFVGCKMLLSAWVHVPIPISLGAIVLILSAAVGASLLRERAIARAETIALRRATGYAGCGR